MKLPSTGALKPYPEMKDSGVPWLGEVPAHWEVLPLCAVATPKSISGQQHRELLSVYLDRGVIRFSEVEEKRTNVTSEDLSKYQAVDPGDFVLNNQQAWRGSVGVSNLSGIVSPAYLVLSLNSRLHTGFANLLFRDRVMVYQYLACSRGVGSIQRNLYWPHLKRVVFASPPPSEQTAIVHFLDHADRRIRRYIRAKQKLIALLEEQKQAIIHQAVTGQIDVRTGEPYSSYKDSGVEWLGKVPEHWEVRRIGGVCKIGNGSTPARSNQAYWNDGSYPWLNSSSVNQGTVTEAEQFVTETALQECHLPRVPADSVLVGITGQGKTRGMAAVLAIEATINQHVAYITPNNSRVGVSPGYLHMCLTAAYTELRAISSASGSTKEALTCEDIKSFRVVLPPVDEQEAVLLAIRRKLANVEGCADLEQRQINLVKGYRTRLIADVVTGKLDVREAAAELPEVDPLGEDDLDGTIHDRENSNLGELDAEESTEEYTIEKEMPL